MNILFIYYKEVLANAGGISRITASLTKLFRDKGNNVWLLGIQEMKSGNYDPFQLFFPSPHSAEENFVFFDELCNNKGIDIVINQIPLLHTWIFNILDRYQNKYSYKIVSCLHNPVMSQVTNLYYRKGYQLRNHKLLLSCFNGGIVLKILKWYYKYKHKDEYIKLLKNSDHVIVLCDGMYKELSEMIGYNKIENVTIIPNFIESAENNDNNSKGKSVVWCGNVNFDVKRVDIALHIWERIQKEMTDWQFYILGDGPGLKAAMRLAKDLNLKNCHFEGRVAPEEYYRAATFSLITSSYESFSLVTLESLFYGVIPIVFNTFPAVQMMLKNGYNGYIIEPYDIETCATKIIETIKEENKSFIMSKNAKDSVKPFLKDEIYKKWLEVFSTSE